MSDTTPARSIVTSGATTTLRLKPSILVMLVRLRAAEATLELGLASVKQRAADASLRLNRLGATRVDTGEPHEDDRANPDPMARMRAARMPRRHQPAEAPLPERRGVNINLTATWDIDGKSVEEVLMLVDQLRFDAAADADTPSQPVADPPSWSTPQEQMRVFMAQMAEQQDDRSPKFLYLARPTDEQLAQATADAYATARRTAERLARAVGRRLGELVSLGTASIAAEHRSDRVMERQRCAALVEASSYVLQEGEVVSEDPRTVLLPINVHTGHHLE